MPTSVVSFPTTSNINNTVIDQKITDISPEMRADQIHISPNVQKFVSYPAYLKSFTYSDIVTSSSEKMDEVYERVTSFLQKIHEDDVVL